MRLACEIMGVTITAHTSGRDIAVDVGGCSCTAEDVLGLTIPRGDVTGVAELAGYVFDAGALTALRQVLAAASLAAVAEMTHQMEACRA